jgi:putative ABC transport system permease protein
VNLAYSASLAFNSLARSKLRTWLTITGVVIGVAAVVLIISLGNALTSNVSSQLGGLGANVITVSLGASRAAALFGGGGGAHAVASSTTQLNLTTQDLQTIQLVPNVQVATGIVTGRASISYRGQNASVSITGIDPQVYWTDFGTSDTLGEGRLLTPSDSYAIVIGYNIANNYFTSPLTPNSVVTIGGQPFRVVGILAQSGSGFGGGGGDNSVIMPISVARTTIGGFMTNGFMTNQFSSIDIYAADATLLNQTTTELTYKLMLERHETPTTTDFSVVAAESIRASISSITSSLAAFLGMIAAVSLLVGAIGIANTMFMTVLERTRQIGIFKALGATSSEVSRLFLIEASLLGLAGGAMGLALSFLVTFLLSALGIAVSLGLPGNGRGGIDIAISPSLIVLSLVFSVIIGALAGYFPARQASKLKPVEALRYE